jgi:membrane protease YdiL (CAAX protease family)
MPAIVLGSDRFLAPGRWLWLRALGWGVALFVLLALAAALAIAAWAALGRFVFGTPMALAVVPATTSGQIGYFLGTAATLAAYVGLIRLGERRRADELALAPAPLELAAGLAIGAAMMAVTILLLYLAGGITLARHPVESIGKAVALSVQSGFVEEILFRLVVLRLVWRAFGPWPALAFSACLFGALHLFNPNATAFAALAIAVEAGIMLAAFYILTGRLWVSIGVHAGWNFTQGWLFGAAVSGTGGFAGGPLLTSPVPGTPQWLSGGAFGPEASVAGLLVGTLVGIVVLRLAARRGAFLPGEAKAGTEAAPGA